MLCCQWLHPYKTPFLSISDDSCQQCACKAQCTSQALEGDCGQLEMVDRERVAVGTEGNNRGDIDFNSSCEGWLLCGRQLFLDHIFLKSTA